MMKKKCERNIRISPWKCDSFFVKVSQSRQVDVYSTKYTILDEWDSLFVRFDMIKGTMSLILEG